jgi:hypothetical protein
MGAWRWMQPFHIRYGRYPYLIVLFVVGGLAARVTGLLPGWWNIAGILVVVFGFSGLRRWVIAKNAADGLSIRSQPTVPLIPRGQAGNGPDLDATRTTRRSR